jgi:Putative restriction endonuclease
MADHVCPRNLLAKWQIIAILLIIKRPGNNGGMSPVVNISAELSPAEIYARLAWIRGLTVELLAGNVVVRGGNPAGHASMVWRLTRTLTPRVSAMDAAIFFAAPIPVRASGDVVRPDLAVVPHRLTDLDASDLPLVAEVVAIGTADEDRHVKPLIYARSQVPLYLLIDGETVTLFSDPSDGWYQTQATVAAGEKLTLPEPFGIEIDTGVLVP